MECFLPSREWDLEDEARDVERLVRVAKSSGLTRESDSIPNGPCVVVRRGEGSSSIVPASLDLKRVERLVLDKRVGKIPCS